MRKFHYGQQKYVVFEFSEMSQEHSFDGVVVVLESVKEASVSLFLSSDCAHHNRKSIFINLGHPSCAVKKLKRLSDRIITSKVAKRAQLGTESVSPSMLLKQRRLPLIRETFVLT